MFTTYAARFPRLGDLARSIVVARNQEFADPATKLVEGDEVAFLPPVSGGRNSDDLAIREAGHYFALTRRAIDTRAVIAHLLNGAEGAVVTFEGTVRNHTKGRATRCPGLRVLRSHGDQDDGPNRTRDRRRAPDRAGRHGAPPGTHVNRRNQRGGGRHRAASTSRVRGLARGHQPAQESGPYLEEGALCRRRGLGGRRVGREYCLSWRRSARARRPAMRRR